MSRRAIGASRHIGVGEDGFSMVEVLTVLVIFGILAAMVGPRINLAPARAGSAASLAGSTLLAAQRAAVARQHNVVVAFDQAGRRLRVHYDADNDGRVDTDEHVTWVALPEGVVFGRAGATAGRAGAGAVSFRLRQDGYPAVFFLRNGSASEEGGFYLTTAANQAAGKAAEARMVVLDRATGRPGWQRYDGSTWKPEF
ncbi:MAG TPA: type II secretion system protein [Longimicrobium sp.]|nr:type II secretion system protein [Longimicrobium sp.]